MDVSLIVTWIDVVNFLTALAIFFVGMWFGARQERKRLEQDAINSAVLDYMEEHDG